MTILFNLARSLHDTECYITKHRTSILESYIKTNKIRNSYGSLSRGVEKVRYTIYYFVAEEQPQNTWFTFSYLQKKRFQEIKKKVKCYFNDAS